MFTASRYLRYAIQILRGVLVAKYLGPYLFGIWGFITLMQRYLTYTNLGIQYALSVELSTKVDQNLQEQERMIASGITITLFITVALVLLALAVRALPVPLFGAFQFEKYVLLLAAYIGLHHLEQVFINIYRVFGRLGRVAVTEIVNASLPLSVVFLYSGERLISALLGAMIVAAAINLLILFFRAPFRVGLSINRDATTRLVKVGALLLVYNFSVYLVPLAARTLVGIHYPIETLGYFTLAVSLSRSVFLGLESISWVFRPMIFSRVRTGQDHSRVAQAVRQVTQLYGTTILLVVLLASIGVPLLFRFLPAYLPVQPLLQILLIGGALNALPLAHSSLAIVRGRQLTATLLNSIAFGLMFLLGWYAGSIESAFIWIGAATLLGQVLVMVFALGLGFHLLQFPMKEIWNVLPASAILALLLTLLGTAVGRPMLLSFVALIFYAVTNRDNILKTFEFTRTFILEKREIGVLR